MSDRDYVDPFDTIVFVVSPGNEDDKWQLTIDETPQCVESPEDVLWRIIKAYIGYIEER